MKKFSSLLFVLLLMMTSLAAKAQDNPRGDVNRDGFVNISDVTCLIDNLLNGVSEGDVNQNGTVDISDVTCLIDYLLQGTWPDEPVTPPDDHEYVDLGLPSGTLWATMNIGANAPEEFGDYFAWGETEPKDDYSWTTYKWCEGTSESMTKYCCVDFSGTVDGKSELDPEDDAAYVNWGEDWRMPTYEQVMELLNNCTWTMTTVNGVSGRLVTGPNGNTMFMPIPGFRIHEELKDPSWAYYWTREIY